MSEVLAFVIDNLSISTTFIAQANVVTDHTIVLNDKVNEYQTIMASANQILQKMISRIPYMVIATLTFTIFWVVSIFLRRQ